MTTRIRPSITAEVPAGISVRLPAEPGVDLGATVWLPQDPASAAVAALINAGAGIRASYYQRYAGFLAANGVIALTYDYRGIGRSRPRSLRGYPASVSDWGEKDCAAAIEWLSVRYPQASVAVIGHSVGALLTGVAPNADRIRWFVTVGGHTAYWRDYAGNVRIPMFLLWHAFMPAVTRAVGYFPGRALRLLEDLPAGVAHEWAQRRKPEFYHHFRTAEGTPDQRRIDEMLRRFASVEAKLLALSFTDDPFATTAATDRLVSLYPNCCTTQLRVSPRDVGERAIGHFGFFRERFRATLWQRSLDWLVN